MTDALVSARVSDAAPNRLEPAGASPATRSVRGAALLGVRQLLTILLSAVSAVLLARWLEPSDFGLFATLNLVVFGAATLFGDLGVTVSLVRQPDEPPPGEWAAAKRMLGGLAAGSLVAGAVGAGVVWSTGRTETATWVMALVVALAARFARAVPSARLQRRRAFGALAAIEMVESVIYFAIVVCMARFGFGAGSLAVAVGAKELTGFGAQSWAARGSTSTRGVPGLYGHLLRTGTPVQASGLAVALTDVFQPLFIGSVLGLTALGHVTWAYNLVLMPILLIGAMDRVVLPELARVQQDRTLLSLVTARAVRLNALVVFPVVVAVLVAPSELVSLVFSDRWLPAADLLVMFVPAVATTAVSAPLLHAFNALGRTSIAMWLSLGWLVSTWTIGAGVTAKWGTIGFGLFYVVLQLTYLPLWGLGRRQLGVSVWSETFDAFAGAAAGAVIGSVVGSTMVDSFGDSLSGRWVSLLAALVVGEAVFVICLLTVRRERTRADAIFLYRGIVGRSRPQVTTNVHASEQRWSLDRVRALDGLRGLAVLAVMFHHANFPYLEGGFLGVDVFFVLSGFLITALVVGELETNQRFDLLRFYARRAARLMPALVVMVSVACAVLWLWPQGRLRSDSLASAGWSLAYLTNYLAMIVERSLGVFGHTWSLAIEEQFYLVWPPALLAAIRWRGRRGAMAVAVSLALVVALVRAWVWLSTGDVEQVYFPLHTRADALFVGCFLALAMTAAPASLVRRVAAGCRWVATAALAGVGVVMVFATVNSGWVYLVGLPLVAVGSALLVAQIAGDGDSALARGLQWRPLVWLGSVSYGLYLWHVPVFELLKDAMPGLAFRYLVVMQFGLSIAAAALSYRLVERRFEVVRDRLRPSEHPHERT